MTATSFWSNAAVKAGLDAMTALLNVGGAGSLRKYSGTAPADADAALSGNTLLAQLTFNSTAFGASTDANPNALATANAITQDSSADATGTHTFTRCYNNAGTCVWQGTAGTSAACDIVVTTSIVATQIVTESSFTFTLPEQGT